MTNLSASKLDDYDYDLPADRIALTPATPRDSSRLQVLDRKTGKLRDKTFRDLPEILRPGDLLVLNDTLVLPRKIRGVRLPGGGNVELLLLQRLQDGCFEALAKPGRRLHPGTRLAFLEGRLPAEVIGVDGRTRTIRFSSNGDLSRLLDEVGEAPLPPYIRREKPDRRDREWYQTIYARRDGAVAAPTAGLHFTKRVFADLEARRIDHAFVTLHVGLGTFQPIEAETLENHRLAGEKILVLPETLAKLRKVRAEGGRIVAVGTTCCRVLEGLTEEEMEGEDPVRRSVDLFIYPPYRFQRVDALITNFHLPRSSLYLLAAAFAGPDRLRMAYESAIGSRYRFFSYGDAMVVL